MNQGSKKTRFNDRELCLISEIWDLCFESETIKGLPVRLTYRELEKHSKKSRCTAHLFIKKCVDLRLVKVEPYSPFSSIKAFVFDSEIIESILLDFHYPKLYKMAKIHAQDKGVIELLKTT